MSNAKEVTNVPYYPYHGCFPILNCFHICFHQPEICRLLRDLETRRDTFEKLGIRDRNVQDKLVPSTPEGPLPTEAWELLQKELEGVRPRFAW